MHLHLRDLTNDDWPLIARWLHADHVRRTWGDPEENLQLLRAPVTAGGGRAIIAAAGRGVGLVQWQHPTRAELVAAGLTEIPTSAIDIDILIGEVALLGQGLGSRVIRLVAEQALSDPRRPFVMACVRPDNQASRRAFAKAGFHAVREFEDGPHGRYLLLVRRRRPAADDDPTQPPSCVR